MSSSSRRLSAPLLRVLMVGGLLTLPIHMVGCGGTTVGFGGDPFHRERPPSIGLSYQGKPLGSGDDPSKGEVLLGCTSSWNASRPTSLRAI